MIDKISEKDLEDIQGGTIILGPGEYSVASAHIFFNDQQYSHFEISRSGLATIYEDGEWENIL